MTLKKGEKSLEVQKLQHLLLALGERLPRFGADGALGEETLAAVEHALRGITGAGIAADDFVSADEIEALQELFERRQESNIAFPSAFLACVSDHALPKPNLCKPRSWAQVDSIVLHQTACVLGEEPRRWYDIPIHVGITRAGLVLWLNKFDINLPHANGFNSRSVGIEIDGAFAGVEGDKKTFWAGGGYKEPMSITPAQIDSARQAVRWIVDICKANGAQIKHVFAHRQSSSQRVSDPGSKVWQEVALWAEKTLGLTAGGEEGYCIGGGKAIPKEWDSRRLASY
jgi:hypothetical protein